MKKTITLTVILLICISVTYGQRLIPNAVIRAKHFAYKIDPVGSTHMFVHNEKNVYRYPDKKPNSPEQVDNLKINKTSLINAFKKVFDDQKLQQLLLERFMGIEYIVSDDGKILEVSFTLNKNTIITATELEELEDTIKKDIAFKWVVPHKSIGGFYQLQQIEIFSKILDGTLGG